jgi:hypothetical protein
MIDITTLQTQHTILTAILGTEEETQWLMETQINTIVTSAVC